MDAREEIVIAVLVLIIISGIIGGATVFMVLATNNLQHYDLCF